MEEKLNYEQLFWLSCAKILVWTNDLEDGISTQYIRVRMLDYVQHVTDIVGIKEQCPQTGDETDTSIDAQP